MTEVDPSGGITAADLLPPPIRALQERVRAFAQDDVAPVARTYDWDQPIPTELLRDLQARARSMGLWLLDVPEEFGGQGTGLLRRCVIEEEVSQVILLGYGQNELFGPNVSPILYQCDDEQRERFLLPVIRGELKVCFAQTEPEAGSDPKNMETRATLDGSTYRLTGTKRFIGNADHADYAQVVCKTRTGDDGPDEFIVLMVPMAARGVRLVRQFQTISGWAPWEIAFDDVEVPVSDRIGAVGAGFELAQRWLTVGRVRTHGARCLGIATRAVEMAIDRASERRTFGAPLADRQAIQFMIAESATELWASRLMVYRTAAMADAGHDISDESFMIKSFLPDMATRAVDRSIQIHGGMGLTRDLPLEYWYRYLRTARITEGATEVLRWRLARSLIKRRQAATGRTITRRDEVKPSERSS